MLNLDKLKNIQFCRDLSADELKRLAEIASGKNIQKGEILFLEGDPALGFFVLLDGLVRIYKAAPDGKEYTVHIIKPGQIFAEAAIFRGDKYPANCSALEKSEVIYFPKDSFISLLTQYPQISLKIIASLSAFVRDFNRQVEELSLKEIPARLASFLLHKYYESKSNEITLDISKTELANRLGTISETLSRNLKKLKEMGLLNVDGKKINIVDVNQLAEIAAGKKIN